MYKRIIECLKENRLLPLKGRILGISGITNFYPFIDKKNSEIIETEYPDVDMQNLSFNNDLFDFVISEQVIEHLKNPQKAISESYRVLKRGGIGIHTTCFVNYFHPSPEDFWRFSSHALRYLCKDFSEILQCEGWGNRIALLLCFVSDKFRFMKIPETKWGLLHFISTYNEERYPIVTWVVIKK